MSTLRNLASQTAVYGVSAIMSKFLNYLLTPYLTRVLSDTVYGEVSLFYAIIPFANVMLTMGLSTAYFRYAAQCSTIDGGRERGRLFTTLWGAVSAFAVLFFVMVAFFRGSIADVLSIENSWYLVLTAALIMVDNVAAIPLASLRQRGRAGYYTFVNVTGVVVNVVVCWACYTFIDGARGEAGWVLVANITASVASLILLMPPSLRMLQSAGRALARRVDYGLLKRVLIYSLPLMLAGLMGTAGDFIDRIMLWQMLPEEVAKADVGIYSAVAKIAALMVIFRQIYSLGAEPFFLQKFKGNDFRELNARAMNFFCVAGIMIFLLITLFQNEFAMILGGGFRVGMTVVPLLLLANLLSGVLINLSFWYKVVDMTRMALYVTLSGITATIALNVLLIPMLGYQGSAWARVGATMVMVVMSYVLGQKYCHVPYNLRRLGLYFAVGGAIYALSFATGHLQDMFIGGIWVRYFVNLLLLLAFAVMAIKVENIQLPWRKLKLKS